MALNMEDRAEKEFSLHWDNFATNFTANIDDFLTSGDLVDVTLKVEGQQIKAHRLVLSMCSPYFREIFTKTSANKQQDSGK